MHFCHFADIFLIHDYFGNMNHLCDVMFGFLWGRGRNLFVVTPRLSLTSGSWVIPIQYPNVSNCVIPVAYMYAKGRGRGMRWAKVPPLPVEETNVPLGF